MPCLKRYSHGGLLLEIIGRADNLSDYLCNSPPWTPASCAAAEKLRRQKLSATFFCRWRTFCSSPNKCSFITVGSSEGSHHLIVTWRSGHVVHSLSEEADLSLVWIPTLKAHYNEKPETRGLYLWMPSLLHFSPSRLLLIFYAFPLYNIHSIYI